MRAFSVVIVLLLFAAATMMTGVDTLIDRPRDKWMLFWLPLALLLSWPLADGSLLTPRLLSNLVDAPHTGEAAVLYAFTRTPAQPAAAAQSAVSIWVWLVLAAATLLGSWWPLRLLHQLRTRSAT